MITCPNDNCGAENEDGAKFCECCGTPLPQDKECPSCHNRVKLTAKFCAECGFNFNKQQVADKSGSMLSMGDKNVIAGDVVGKQENIKVSGNATIIKNEDESKKVVTCHVCGQNLLVSEAVKCTDCGEITCSNCIDAKLNVCKNCASRIISNKEDIYKQTLVRFLADGKIEMSERDELKALQNQLGIEPKRAKELEGIVRGIAPINSASTASSSFGDISPFDREYFRKAERLFYEDFNYLETLELTEDLYQKYPSDENILTLHLNALAVADRKKAIEIINNLDVDVLGAVLVDIDIALAINTKNSIGSASEKLARAIPLWSDSTLLKCRQIIYLLKTASLLKDESFFSEAAEIFDSIGEGKNKLERSWIFKAKLALSQYRGDEVPEITEEFCKEKDFYRSVIVDINKEKGRKFFEQAKEFLDNPFFYEKGFSLLLKSAELNYLPAIRELGIAYNDGLYFIEKNQKKAIEFFYKGAEQDDPKCQLELGGCFIEKEDIAEGLKWVKKAVDQEFAEAEFIYSMLYGRGEEIKDDNGNFVIILEKDLPKSMIFLKKSANHDYGPAQFNLGMAYLTGMLLNVDDFCEKDADAALIWLKKAVANQHNFQAEAMFELGKIYEKGEIVPKDETEAKRWYEKAAEAGDIDAKKKLAPPEEKKNIVEDEDDFTDAFEKAMAETDDDDDFDEAFEKAMADDDDENDNGNNPLNVFLDGFAAEKKNELRKELRAVFNIGFGEAERYLNAVPLCFMRDASSWHHSETIEQLKRAGAQIRIEKGNDAFGKNMTNTPPKIEPLPERKPSQKCTEQTDTSKQPQVKDVQKNPSAESNIDNIDFMAVLAKIIDNAIYVLPTDNVNKKKRWNEKQNSLKECGCFGISSNKLHSRQIIAYMEEKGILFGISNSVILTPDAIFTKKGVVVDITPETTAKFVADRSAKKFKDLIVDGIEVCSFFDVSPFGMEQWVNAIETIVRAQKASNEQLLLLAKHYLINYSHCSFYPAYIVAFWAASQGCPEAITLIREIALQENDPYNFHSICCWHNQHLEKFEPEIRFIYRLLQFNSYNIKNRFPNEDDKYYKKHKQNVLDVIHGFYASFKDGNAEAAYYIAQILENGWGTISEIANVVKEKDQPDQTSFVYWYKKSAEGNFPAAIEQVKKFDEWEKEIAEKAPEEFSFAAKIYADKKLGILFNKEHTVLMKYPSSLETSCYSIPNGVTHIAEKAFAECKSLVKIVIPNSVIRIGNYSFSKCESLAEIILSDHLEFIGGEAFRYCKKLEKINLPESLRIITKYAFSWSGLIEVTIPSGIEIIEDSTFNLCEQLEKVTIGENVETIGCSAFFKCKKLKNIIWGKKLRYIKREAFKSCSALTHLALPSTVYTPDYHVFDDCINLASVMFPDGTGSEHEKLLPTGCVPYVVPRNSEYENIVQLYEDAYSGAVESQYQFAEILMSGKGIKQNMREAVKWFSKAAEKGNIQAFLALGYAYSKGNGIAKDLNKAFEFFKKAAEQKNAEAQYELGICFSEGKGVAQDSAESINYFALAAEQGHEKAKQAEEAEIAKAAEEARLSEEAAKNAKSVDLILESCGTSTDEVCKKICEIFQIEYAHAKEYTDIVPVYLCQEISLSDAEYVKQKLETVGAVLRIESSVQEHDSSNCSQNNDYQNIRFAQIMITDFSKNDNKETIINLIRNYCNLGGVEAKRIFEQNQKYFVDFDSWDKAFSAFKELQSAGAAVSLTGELLSPLPGKVTKLFAEPGKQFQKGDIIACIEAMRMEISIIAPYDCKVIKIGVKPNQVVASDDRIVIFEYKQ